MTPNLSGIFPAIVTPLTPSGDLNEEALQQLLRKIYGAGCHGVYVAGNTGEGTLLPLEVRERLAEAAVRHSPPDRTVIVHIGTLTTNTALRLARHAAEAGVHAISSLPPAGSLSFEEIRTYYQTLAARTTLPFLVYYFPAVAPVIRGFSQIQQLCEIPNVAGLKFTDFDLYTLSRLKRSGRTVFNGHDEVLAAGLLMGADGGIGSFYNLEPALFVQLYDAAKRGDWTQARLVQDRINELISIVLAYPLFPAIKRILSWRGIHCGECVEPRRPLHADEAARLRAELEHAGFLASS